MEERLNELLGRLGRIKSRQKRLEEFRFKTEQEIREIIGPRQEVLEVGSHDKKAAGLVQQHLVH